MCTFSRRNYVKLSEIQNPSVKKKLLCKSGTNLYVQLISCVMHIIYASHVICNTHIVYNNVRNVYNNVRNVCFTNMLTNILLVSYLFHIVTVCAYTHRVCIQFANAHAIRYTRIDRLRRKSPPTLMGKWFHLIKSIIF